MWSCVGWTSITLISTLIQHSFLFTSTITLFLCLASPHYYSGHVLFISLLDMTGSSLPFYSLYFSLSLHSACRLKSTMSAAVLLRYLWITCGHLLSCLCIQVLPWMGGELWAAGCHHWHGHVTYIWVGSYLTAVPIPMLTPFVDG